MDSQIARWEQQAAAAIQRSPEKQAEILAKLNEMKQSKVMKWHASALSAVDRGADEAKVQQGFKSLLADNGWQVPEDNDFDIRRFRNATGGATSTAPEAYVPGMGETEEEFYDRQERASKEGTTDQRERAGAQLTLPGAARSGAMNIGDRVLKGLGVDSGREAPIIPQDDVALRSAETLGGLGAAIPMVVNPWVAGAFGATQGSAGYQEAKEAGATDAMAALAGGVEAASYPIMRLVPGAVGKTLAQRLATGAGLGVGTGVATDAAINAATPDKLDRDLLDPYSRIPDAILGLAAGASAAPRARATDSTELPRTGDVAIDEGINLVEAIAKGEQPKAAEQGDLFSPQNELSVDMFSGETVPASLMEQRRLRQEQALRGEEAQRTPEEDVALERDYLLDQQDRLNAEANEGLVSRRGDIPEPFMGLADTIPADVNAPRQRELLTRQGDAFPERVPYPEDNIDLMTEAQRRELGITEEPAAPSLRRRNPNDVVGVRDVQPNQAMADAMLQGWIDRGRLRNEPTPVEARTPETFSPSRNETVDQRPIQDTMELSAQQDMFGSRADPVVQEAPLPLKKQKAATKAAEKATTREELAAALREGANVLYSHSDSAGTPIVRTSSPELLDKLAKGELTTRDVLAATSKSLPTDPKAAQEAANLVKYVQSVADRIGGNDVKFEVLDPTNERHLSTLKAQNMKMDGDFSAFYDPKTNKIYFKQSTRGTNTMIHEAVHGITSMLIANGEAGRLKGPAAQAYGELVTTFENLKPLLEKNAEVFANNKTIKDASTYGLTNLHEFVSEFFSSGIFRNSLKRMKVDPKSASSFPKALRGLVERASSMYDLVVGSLSKIMAKAGLRSNADIGLSSKAESAYEVMFHNMDRFFNSINDVEASKLRDLSSRNTTPKIDTSFLGEQAARRNEQVDTTVTDSPQFRNWFGDSKVVDENGNPLVVYHGTASDISVFDDRSIYEGGIYFTSDPRYAAGRARIAQGMGSGPAPNVMPAYVRILNPAPAGMSVAQAKAEGYDGIIRDNEIVAFAPIQIKSAIGNTGAFDPSDPRIHMAPPEPAQDAGAHSLKNESELQAPRSRAKTIAKQAFNPKGIEAKVYDARQTQQGEQAAGAYRASTIANRLEAGLAKSPDLREKASEVMSGKADPRAFLDSIKASNPDLHSGMRDFLNDRAKNAREYAAQIVENPNATDREIAFAMKALKDTNSYIHRAYEANIDPPKKGFREWMKGGYMGRKLTLAERAETKVGGRDNLPLTPEQKALLTPDEARSLDELRQVRGYVEGWVKPSQDKLDDMSVDDLGELYRLHTGLDPAEVTRPFSDNKVKKDVLLAGYQDALAKNKDMNQFVDNTIKQLSGLSPDKTGAVITFAKNMRLGSDVFAARSNVPPQLRAWWGEIKDPVAQAIQTLSTQTSQTSQLKAMNQLRKEGLGSIFTEDASSATHTETITGEKMGALRGLKTTPDVKKALDSVLKIDQSAGDMLDALVAEQTSPNAMARYFVDPALAMLQNLSSAKKLATIVWNQGRWAMNLAGSFGQTVANGNVNAATWKRGAAATLNAIQSSNRKSTNPDVEMLFRYNIWEPTQISEIYSGAGVTHIRNMLKKAAGTRTAGDLIKLYAGNVSNFMKEGYSSTDLWTKAANFFHDLDVWTEHYKKLGVDKSPEEIARFVAERTNNANITPSRAPTALKAIEKLGITQYLPYQAETFRTTYHNVRLGMGDMAEGSKTGDMRLMRNGAQRLLGAVPGMLVAQTGYHAGLATSLGALGYAVSALSDDDERRKYLDTDPMHLGSEVVVLKDEDGREYTIDVGQLPPMDPAMRPTQSVIDAIYKASTGDTRGAQTSIENAGKQMWSMLSHNSMYRNLFKAATGDEPSLKRSNPEAYEKISEELQALGAPKGMIDRVLNAAEIYAPKGGLSVLKATTSTASPAIKKLEAAGIGLRELNPAKDLNGFFGYERKEKMKEAKAAYATTLKQNFPADPELAEKQFVEGIKDAAKPFAELKQAIRAAKEQGTSQRELAERLKGMALSEEMRGALIRGRSLPIKSMVVELEQDLKQKLIANLDNPERAVEAKRLYRENTKLIRDLYKKYRNVDVEELINGE